MEKRLADLCKMCNIYYEGELEEIEDAADEWGLPIVLSAMKRLSITAKDPGKYPVEQFRAILSQKVRELLVTACLKAANEAEEDAPF